MIPLRDNAARRRLTAVNTALIVANLAVFGYELSLGSHAGAELKSFGLVPWRLGFAGGGDPLRGAITLVTSLFLHGGVLHVAGNMLYLYIFGPAVEERMGHARYFGFYIAAGVAAGIATVWMAPRSTVPVIGASGAIAGVLGAYFIYYPRGRILTLVPLFLFVELFNVPAVLYLLLWFVIQVYGGMQAQAAGGMAGGVAWWAHVGGFLFGIAIAPIIASAPRQFRGRLRA
jgi:membrane associated rhomboid family serine protease